MFSQADVPSTPMNGTGNVPIKAFTFVVNCLTVESKSGYTMIDRAITNLTFSLGLKLQRYHSISLSLKFANTT